MHPYKRLGFLTAFSIPLVTLLDVYWLHTYWLTVGFVFVLIPFLDQLLGRDPENISEATVLRLSEEGYFRGVLLVWAIFQVGFLFWAAGHVAGHVRQPLDFLGFVLSVALSTGGIGITVAHELGHKRTRWEPLCAQGLLMTVGYMHFFIEHNFGHHVWVGTSHDPATARRGQSVYAFWWQSVVGGWRSAWAIETKRLGRAGHTAWHWRNRMLWYALLPWLFAGALAAWAEGNTGLVLLFWLLQSMLAFSLLEIVNYIEHYGLTRRQLPDGSYERVREPHSWNANHLLSNLLLFQLQRHADHHAHSGRRYQVLRHFDTSPQLPFGYPLMILIALCPPLWFAYMHPRLEKLPTITA
ncbi:MAG: alkane 1-monooxygenase [Bernardetiaceae bacterium]